MFIIDNKSRQSIQEQIVHNYKELIVTGVLKANDKIPSVREMSKTITVNPNTVQKAYSRLEEEGFIYVVKGKGSFVSDMSERKIDDHSILEVKKHLKEGIDKLYHLGLDVNEIRVIVNEMIEMRGK